MGDVGAIIGTFPLADSNGSGYSRRRISYIRKEGNKKMPESGIVKNMN